MVDFAKLKSAQAKNTADLVASLKQPTQQKSYDDDRQWKLTLDKEKNLGGAVIRFLPTKDDATLSYVSYFEHSFKNESNNKYYIERSLSSLNPPVRDALSLLNARLWQTGTESNKQIARNQKRNTRYVANILVVNDPAHPDNNGKVFLYKFGPKIFSFIQNAVKPEVDALTGVAPDSMDVFDMWNGANLELRIKNTTNGWNYDASKFSKLAPVHANDSLIEAVFNQTYSLSEFVAESNYKTPEALAKRLLDVLGTSIAGIEVIEGGSNDFPSANKPQETQAPRQMESQTKDDSSSLFDGTPIKEATFEKSADEDFFATLMADA